MRNRWLALAALLLAFPAVAQVAPGSLPFAPLPLTTNNCVKALNAFQGTDAGSPCGMGTVSSGTINQLAYYAATGSAVSGLATANSGVLVTSAGGVPSISSTLPAITLADGATWGTTGLANAASYTTSSTSVVNIAPTWNFSSTGNGISPIIINPTLSPTGASAGNINANAFGANLASSSVNVNSFRALALTPLIASSYTGTITAANGLFMNFTNSGTNAIGTLNEISLGGLANGNGITSGSVTNNVISTAASTAAAGSGGTVVNNTVLGTLGSGSSSGTTNRGVYITGNGGAASTNYALYSDSTAPSLIAGTLTQFGLASGTPSHLSSAQTTAPALTSCGTGSPAIVGTDTAGEVTMGTTATGCVITFNVAYGSAPFCLIDWESTPLASQSFTVSSSAITTTQTSASGNKLTYLCVGRAGG